MTSRVLVRWYSVCEAGKKRGVLAATLRKGLDRNKRSIGGRLVAEYDDMIAYKLGAHWRVTFGEIWPKQATVYRTRHAAAVLGMLPTAFRRACQRGTLSAHGINGRKRNGRWQFYFDTRWMRPPGECVPVND